MGIYEEIRDDEIYAENFSEVSEEESSYEEEFNRGFEEEE